MRALPVDSIANGPAIALGEKIMALEPSVRSQVLNQAIEQAVPVLLPLYKLKMRDMVLNNAQTKNTTVPVGYLSPKAVDFVEKHDREKIPTSAVILAQDKRLKRMIRAIKVQKNIAISDDFLMNLPKYMAHPDKIFWDKKNRNLLYLIGIPNEKTAKIAIEINQAVKLEKEGKKTANYVWSGSLIRDETGIRRGIYQQIK